jgi:hypothetical protein
MMTPIVGASWLPKEAKRFTAVKEGVRAFSQYLKVLSVLRDGLILQCRRGNSPFSFLLCT